MQQQDEQLEKALRHHTAGELPQAEAIYRAVIEQDPNDPDALHLLGALLAQSGRVDEALTFLDRAIQADPRSRSSSILNAIQDAEEHNNPR